MTNEQLTQEVLKLHEEQAKSIAEHEKLEMILKELQEEVKSTKTLAEDVHILAINMENMQKAQESRKRAVMGKKDNKEYYFSSITEARKKLKIGNHISECCNKVYGYKKCGGYEWRYADE